MAINVLKEKIVVKDPPLAQLLFADTRFSVVWLVVRLYLGYQWINAGLHKIVPGWVETGESLKGFWTKAIAIPPTGSPAIAFDWYRDFINYLLVNGAYTWMGKVIAYGELLVGVGLILGAFVGIAAFFGALMNWNFIMAGAASTNGLLFIVAILLIMAWKTAGYLGLDYVLLPLIGTPWSKVQKEPATAVQGAQTTPRTA
ncbi:MAG: DoxX family protein [Chloroflexi bacterium]|nr:DoxX family protein [Chloroflexota bacterium]